MTNDPLSAEAVLKFVQAMGGAQTSESHGHRELAGWVQPTLNESLNESTLDAGARTFRREIAFAAASGIRGSAVQWTAFKWACAGAAVRRPSPAPRFETEWPDLVLQEGEP